MSSVVISGDTSGAITIAAPAVAGTNTLTLPASTGTVIYKDANGTTTLNSNASQSPLVAQINGTEALKIDTSGNLLVGGATTSSKLNVLTSGVPATFTSTSAGDMFLLTSNTAGSSGTAIYVIPCRFGSTAVLGGGLYWNGSVMSLQGTSDYRLKEDIKPLESALETIGKLNPVTYTWINSNQPGAGFIAHEFQQVLPNSVVGQKDAVDENGKEIPQSIDQTSLIVYLTKAIKELKAEIDVLKAGK
jgi:hypothetical protein